MNINCPFCYSYNRKIITKDFRNADGKKSIVECQKCGLKYLFPPRNKDEEKNFYDSNLQTKKIIGNNFNLDRYLKNSKNDIERRVKFCKKYIQPRTSILDIGCGYGYFIKLMKDQGFRVAGIDRSVERTIIGSKKFKIKIINDYLENISENVFQDSSFDLITVFHVLEHIFNPDALLLSIYSKLKKGGKIIIEIPSGADYMLRFPKYAKFVY